MFGISEVLDVLVQSRRSNAAVYNMVGSTTLLITPCAVRARPQVQGRAQQCASIK
jgi:DNA phosphorothioation-dependent restriction protein DptG